jgi:GrpB-like predicted nucleotidyltransferase (UPF0157 family)
MTVIVEPHNPRWAQMFDDESKLLAQALGPNAVAIHHIGSTAIPGIYAKPTIDIMIEVKDLGELDAHNPGMVALGYQAMGEYGIPKRRFYRKNDQAGARTHHIHAFLTGSPHLKRHVAFRDYLLAHPDTARKYSDLKKKMADKHPDSIEMYITGKDAFITDIDQKVAG